MDSLGAGIILRNTIAEIVQTGFFELLSSLTRILLRGHCRRLDVVSAAQDSDPGNVGDVEEEEADGDLDGGEFLP